MLGGFGWYSSTCVSDCFPDMQAAAGHCRVRLKDCFVAPNFARQILSAYERCNGLTLSVHSYSHIILLVQYRIFPLLISKGFPSNFPFSYSRFGLKAISLFVQTSVPLNRHTRHKDNHKKLPIRH